MKNKLSFLILIGIFEALLGFNSRVMAQQTFNPPEIFKSRLEGKLNTPDKQCLSLFIRYINKNLYIKINNINYRAEEIVLDQPQNIEFCLNMAMKKNRSAKLKFNGKIVDNFSMGGTVYDITGQKGFWWVKIADKQLHFLQ